MILQKLINVLIKDVILQKLIDLLVKTHDFAKNDKIS